MKNDTSLFSPRNIKILTNMQKKIFEILVQTALTVGLFWTILKLTPKSALLSFTNWMANCRLYNLLIKALFRSDCLTLSSTTVLHLALALAISALKWLTGRKRWCVRPLCKLYHRQSRDRWYPHLGASRIPMEKQRKSAL